ncbi:MULTISPECIES: UbiX family flavin prenyltransferase [Methanobacterium]|jgi:4-hydroxy-3-polyprenylbenzoate decarboxylase|uniref:Flavin prenyltransferase UbiX n=1 Tax=Methanobacterium formicicum TaxID=2162 RepID=A0A090I7B5_METFO|nr:MULTISPECIES: UbiX family flavin prenyltransferase [Methanobacterium]AIS31907.1 3-polyprenyl-4-hydroxybenzoate decarboxylase UbiX [Methanobacterium formicicum]KUK75608.1 MAG: 3-octaprenyl-4-hydroxybenzoate carboxy-lyase [Methanobacterium sp. 42_16]MBF4476030.1 UbiX family flavin prenyltransferase [Methanobacterium formicicum]MDD4810559.1 UbiX family flavin prenyltransferase [Methanobacterium formicicum]MDG3547198.1 UbiX family flavin prenyltransferase [Methanobacterium formicicum]
MIVVAITGASGVIYGVRLLEVLKEMGKKTAVVATEPARIILQHEMGMDEDELKNLAHRFYEPGDLTSAINSGSCRFESMIIVPCTMKTLSAISTGFASNAVTRAADVALKERRQLLLVPRETPLRSVHLENMLRISREGGIILPAMPAFYHQPQNMDDLVDFLVGKILDVMHIDHNLYQRWQGEAP